MPIQLVKGNAERGAAAAARTDAVIDHLLLHYSGKSFQARDLPRAFGRNAVYRALKAGVSEGFLRFDGRGYHWALGAAS